MMFISQHGIAGGYYLTFLMGGFITAAARQARANFRPLLVAPASKPDAPASSFKPIYDLGGIVLSAMILNYSASPFIILSAKDSITTWKSLGWYGHVIVMGSLVFFYAGGTKFFRNLQKKKGVLPPPRGKPAAPGSDTNGTSSGVSTPLSEKNFVMPPSVDTFVRPEQLQK